MNAVLLTPMSIGRKLQESGDSRKQGEGCEQDGGGRELGSAARVLTGDCRVADLNEAALGKLEAIHPQGPQQLYDGGDAYAGEATNC